MKKTKVLVTVGPACSTVTCLKKMVRAGMNAVRFNTAHGNIAEYGEVIERVRKVADLPVIFDIKGPEIRIQSPCDEHVKRGQLLSVGFKKCEGRYFNRNFYKELSLGDILFLSDGLIKTELVEKKARKVKLKVHVGGFLRKNKGVNIPGKHLHFSLFTAWDKEVIEYAKKVEADFIALSFARTANDVYALKKRLAGSEIGVISKIENHESIENLPAIVEASEGIMVARGDLGVEFPSEKLPILQKQIICGCNRAGKPVIVATEMLKSMIWEPRPTRAETSDVANAILDGADGIMLSDETAIGAYPVDAVWEMNRIATEVEPMGTHNITSFTASSVDDSIANAVHRICERIPIAKVVCITRSGYTAQLVSRFRLDKEIIALTDSHKVRKKLELVYGVRPEHYRIPKYRKLPHAAKHLLDKGFVHLNDLVIITAGMYAKKSHVTNVVHIHRIRELVEYINK